MSQTKLDTKGRGTGIAPENLQEVLEASKNGAVGQSAFFTPLPFAKACARPLPESRRVITDLSAGSGQLIIGSANETTQLGLALDIENCRTKHSEGWQRVDTVRIAGDCTKVFTLLKEVSFQADCFVLNPPWSLHWHRENLAKLAESDLETVRQAFGSPDPLLSAGQTIDSTAATMMMALDLMSRRGEGYLIANNDTLERLIFKEGAPFSLLAAHVWATAIVLGNPMTGEIKQTFDKEKDFFTGVIWFARDHVDGLDPKAVFRCQDVKQFETATEEIRLRRYRWRSGVTIMGGFDHADAAEELWKSVRAEWEIRQGKRKADYNIWMDAAGSIQTYLSVFENKSIKIPKQEAVSLFQLNGKKAMELVMMRTDRQLLLHHVNGGIWRVHPDLPRQIEAAVSAYYAARAPLYPLNPIQSLGFVDETETLECKIDMGMNSELRIPSPVEKIVMEIRKLNLRLGWKKGDRNYLNELKIGPKDKMPKDLLAAIEANKDEIIDFLESEKKQGDSPGSIFRAGKSYSVRTQTVSVSRTAKKLGHDGEEHEHFLKGQELAIWVRDETGVERLFMDRRHALDGVKVEGDEEREGAGGYKYSVEKEMHPDFDLQTIAKHFAIPSAPDVALCQPENYQAKLKFIDTLESMIGGGFALMPFQRRDLARAALHDGLILGFQPGMGKTLAGIVWALMKVGLHPESMGRLLPAEPVLIVAPENLHFQMIQDYKELFGAAMPEVIELDSQETYLKLEPLKPGWYMSSFTQIAANKVKKIPEIPEDNPDEPTGISESDLADFMHFFEVTVAQAVAEKMYDDEKRLLSVHDRALMLCRRRRAQLSEGVGIEDPNGVKCVYSPSLADFVRHEFGCVVIDEAVKIKAEDSIIGIGVRSLDPKYRLVLTGTPIKNRLPDVFFLCAWACNALKAANARWPYHGNKAGEIERFAEEFMVMGRDLTKERKEAESRGGQFYHPDKGNRRRGKERKGKPTPEVCNVHRLWKLLAPVVLRRLKKDIGSDMVKKTKKLIYVPMGSEQAKVYNYHLKASYIDKNGKEAVAAKLQALRNCAAAPHTSLLEYKGEVRGGNLEILPYRSQKDYIPKLHACLTVIEEVLRRREQIVVFSAFHEPLDTLSRYLTQAGIRHDVLDGRMSAGARGRLAMEFKLGLPRAKPVLLAGNKAMAEGNSWNLCNNVGLYAFDWALDLFLQAIDRVHRLNSRKDVNIYPFVGLGTIDRKLESMIDEKDDSTELVLDGQLMTEIIEEVNLSALLQIAQQEFTADKAMPEDECLAQWPDLCRKLAESNKLLIEGAREAKLQKESEIVVIETLKAPIKQILQIDDLPSFGDVTGLFGFA